MSDFHGGFKSNISGLIALSNLTPLVQRVFELGAHNVAKRMQRNIVAVDFVDTGLTLNTVRTDRLNPHQWSIGPTTNYAIYGEFGTSRMAARPFARPALDAEKPHFLQALKAAIEKHGTMKGGI